MASLRRALFRDLDEGKMQALGQRLYERAVAGDLEATKLLLLYACGRPRPCPDEDALDLSEWKLLAAGPSLAAAWHGIYETADARLALQLWKQLSADGPDALLDQLAAAVEGNPQGFARNLATERAARAGR
jgi:hypothetical protein